ncbi:MAG: hypothetical protein JKY65_00610, partial [Planctomycetes bacterium]|nr:hypothetical protein [Planctomycetota bacterium]
MARTSSPFLLFLCGLLAGCCASPVVVGGRFEPRFEIQKRPRIALLSAVLEGGEVWAYGQPAAAVAAVCSHYQAGTGGRVGSLEEAPPAL